MSLGEAAETFTKLTIGDGLVTQIPGLLISLAAGILISRSTRETNLSGEFVSQLFSHPQVLLIAGTFAILLIFTQLPTIPLLLVGGGCIAIALLMPNASPEEPPVVENKETLEKQREQKINRNLAVDPIEIELGVQLIDLARGGVLLNKITAAREEMAAELGIILPKVRVRDNLQLQSDQFQVRINHLPVYQGTVELNRVLLVKKTPAAADPIGIPCAWHEGCGAFWVEENSVSLRAREYHRLTPADVVIESLKHQSRTRAAEIMTRQSTAYLIEQLRETHPATVDELIPEVMRVGQIQQVLQRLLMEQVSIRPLNTILEALADHAAMISDPAMLTEAVRSRLTPWITAALQSSDGTLRVIDIDSDLNDWLESRLQHGETGRFLTMNASEHKKIQSLLRAVLGGDINREKPVALRVSRALRASLANLMGPDAAAVSIVAHNEISQDAKIETIAILRLSDLHYAAA